MTALPHTDVVIVGAGLSGIGAAHRINTECPHLSWEVLEAREVMGGTWDLFRYPGVRSDSDMFTLGYEFKPWEHERALADGATILDYIHETADEFGIADEIRYSTKVVAADFDTSTSLWTLTLETPQGTEQKTCSFLYSCAGYYDYDEGHAPTWEGMDDFAGQVVHPQFWPEDLDWAGKKVVVIGSGATAVTLVPAMAEQAAHVTMLQRTPTWIGAVPGRDKIADLLRSRMPAAMAHKVIRSKNILFNLGFYNFCQRFPNQASALITGATRRILGDADLVAEHFTPDYRPWDQRFCAVPEADFFKAVKKGTASVVTSRIRRFVPTGIELENGETLEADIVVSATGLKLLAFGGIKPSVDGVPVSLPDQFVWQGAMVSGLPNFAVCIGYTNASWTLRADLTHRLVCKVLNHMHTHGYDAAVPAPDPDLQEKPLLDLSSGYVQRSIGDFPRQGDRGPWQVRQNYVLDSLVTLRRDISDSLAFTRTRDRIPA